MYMLLFNRFIFSVFQLLLCLCMYLFSLWVTIFKYKLLCPRGTQTCALAVANIKVNGNTARR